MMREDARVALGSGTCRAAHHAFGEIGHGEAGGSIAVSAVPGLVGSTLADRFRSWRGRSGRRYVFSVYPIGTDDETPRYADAVVIAATRFGDGTLRIVDIAEADVFPDLLFSGGRFARAAAAGATEIHMHLLAPTHAERVALMDNLWRN